MPRPKGTPNILEARRLKGLALYDSGQSLSKVAKTLRCSPSSVMRWKRLRDTGLSLSIRFSAGRPPKVAYPKLEALILKNPKACGKVEDLVDLIFRRLGVSYHPVTLIRLLQRLGFHWTPGYGWRKVA